METVADLDRLKRSHPMLDAVIDEQDGRRIRIGDRWLFDFASCNYLGFDLDPEIIAAVPAYLDQWGTHPSWSRLLGSPVLYEEIEDKVTELVGGEDTLLFPTITHIHMSVIPVLAGAGAIFLDGRAHKTIYDGAMIARGHGASVQHFRHDDPEHLEELLRSSWITPRVIALDGVNSMLGNAPDLGEFARLAREYDALLYVDNTHGCRSRRRARSGRALPVGEARERDHPASGRDVRERDLRRRLLEGVFIPAGLPFAPDAPEGCAEGGRSAVPVFGPLADRLARHHDRRPGCQRATRRHQPPRHPPPLTERVLDRLHELDIYTPNRSGYPLGQNHAGAPRGYRRGRSVPLRSWDLRDDGRLPPRAQGRGRLPFQDHRRERWRAVAERLLEVLGEINGRFDLQHEGHRELLRERVARAGGETR